MSTQYASAPKLLMDSKPDSLRIDQKLDFKPIDLSKAKPEFDFQEEIDKASAAAKNETLVIKEILPETKLRSAGLIDTDIVLLQQARELIEKKEYAEALNKLESFLSKQANHPEALYLKALCLISLDKPMEALKIRTNALYAQINALYALAMIKSTGIDKSLSDLIGILKKRICGQVYIKFPFLLLLNPKNGLENISSLIQYDPYCPDYYAFKAILLNSAHRFFDAYDCINDGIRVSGNFVSRLLTGLKSSTEAQILYASLIPAIKLFKNRQYDQARKELQGVDDFIKGMEEYQLFEKYLKKLTGGGIFGMFVSKKNIKDVKIDGTKEQREKLQLIIVREELYKSRAAIGLKDFTGAETILQTAFHFAPDLPIVCFLLAGCNFRLFNDKFFAGKMGSIDNVIKELNETRKYALVAAADRRNPEATMLLEQIEHASGYIKQISVQIKKKQEEIAKVNELIKEFEDIMSVAKKGIDSLQTFETLFSRMQKLKGSSTKAKSTVSSPDSAKALNDLISAIDINLIQMEELSKAIEKQKKEIEPVNALSARFTAVMDGIKGGIKTENQINQVESDLHKIKKDISSCKTRLKSEAARNSLSQLEKVVDKSITQLDQIKDSMIASMGDNKIVKEQADKFKIVADFLNSGTKFESRDLLVTFRDLVSNNRNDADSAKYKVSSQGAKTTLTQIISQYDNILSQINNAL